MEKIFHLTEHGTNVRTEVIAGLTTFLAMAYILAVNPSILGTVMDANGVFVATAVASAIATFVMAFWANYPIALSAGLGLNAYFAYTVCLGELKDVPNAFTIALTAVFVEGLIFILRSLFKFRPVIFGGQTVNQGFFCQNGGLCLAGGLQRGADLVGHLAHDGTLLGRELAHLLQNGGRLTLLAQILHADGVQFAACLCAGNGFQRSSTNGFQLCFHS